MPLDWGRLVLGPAARIFGEGCPADPLPIRYDGSAGTVWINGVFDEAYLELEPLGRGGLDRELTSLGAPGGISTETPVLGVQMSQFRQPPAQGDRLVVRGMLYAVKEVREDSHGWAKLLLNELGPA